MSSSDRLSRISVPPTRTAQRARFQIAGHDSVVLADVVATRPDGMTLTQSLPLLKIGQILENNGMKMSIARIAIDVQQGMPKLVIELNAIQPKATELSAAPATPAAFKQGREATQSYSIGYAQPEPRETKSSGFFARSTPADFNAADFSATVQTNAVRPHGVDDGVTEQLAVVDLQNLTASYQTEPVSHAPQQSNPPSLWSQLKRAFVG